MFSNKERKEKERKNEILLICVGSGIDWGGEKKGKGMMYINRLKSKGKNYSYVTTGKQILHNEKICG